MARHELVEKALEILKPAGRTPDRGCHEWWTAKWRALAQTTDGLLPNDPRLGSVLVSLAECDRCYQAADMNGFEKATERTKRIMQFTPGARVWWEGHANHRLCILGPATVEMVHCDNGRLWAWVSWQGMVRGVSEAKISRIEGPTT